MCRAYFSLHSSQHKQLFILLNYKLKSNGISFINDSEYQLTIIHGKWCIFQILNTLRKSEINYYKYIHKLYIFLILILINKSVMYL